MVSILLTHVQTIGILGGLPLAWPTMVKHIMAAFSLDMLQVPNAACLLSSNGSGVSPFWIYATAYCAFVISSIHSREAVACFVVQARVGP